MKLNKLILPIILITPLFINSCDSGSGGDVSKLTIDAYEMVYAYSQTCSTSLTINESDVEFVDDFKKDYFTFDKQEDIQGKSYEVKRTAPKTIVVTLTGGYTGLSLSQTENKEITYKINKSAFKDNKVKNDATGKMVMKWDNVVPNHIGSGATAIEIDCLFTPGDIATTKVTLSSSLTSEIQGNLSDYCTPAVSKGTIKFSKVNIGSKDYLRIVIDGLPDEGNHGYSISVPNKTGAILFDNLPDNYGLKFAVKRDAGEDDYNLVDQSKVCFDKVA